MSNDALLKAQAKAAQMRADGWTPTQRTPAERAAHTPASLRAAINHFCWECMGESKNEVKRCTCVSCPLHRLRPWQ